MTRFTMPSSRAAADEAFMRGAQNPLSGRQPPPGNALTGQPAATNALAAGYAPLPASPPQIVNRLTGQSAPVSAPPPSAIVAAPPPAPPDGQRLSAIIDSHLKPAEFSPADLDTRINRVEFIRNALGNLLKKRDITHEDCVDLVQAAIKGRMIPAAEAGEILGSLPTDPTKLRAEMEHRYKIALHALILLHGEQQNRSNRKAA